MGVEVLVRWPPSPVALIGGFSTLQSALRFSVSGLEVVHSGFVLVAAAENIHRGTREDEEFTEWASL
jgi:hypothetical protein